MSMQFNPFPSRIGPKKNFLVHTTRLPVSNLSYTNSTTKHPRILKRLLPWSNLASSTSPGHPLHKPRQTCHTHKEESLSCQDGRTTKIIPTGVASQCNAMLYSTCYVYVVKIFSSWHTKRLRSCCLLMPHPWLP